MAESFEEDPPRFGHRGSRFRARRATFLGFSLRDIERQMSPHGPGRSDHAGRGRISPSLRRCRTGGLPSQLICSPAMRPRRALPGQTQPTHTETLVVACGGAIGATLRGSIERAWLSADPVYLDMITPLIAPVLIINSIGAGAFGLLLGALERRTPHPLLRPFLGIGVLGAFTTFSALALETISISLQSGLLLGVLKLAGSLAIGLLAFLAGERWGRRL